MDQIITSLEVIFNALQDNDHVNMDVINSNFRAISELISTIDFKEARSARLSSAFQLLDDIEVRFKLMFLTNQHVSSTRGLLLKIKQLNLV